MASLRLSRLLSLLPATAAATRGEPGFVGGHAFGSDVHVAQLTAPVLSGSVSVGFFASAFSWLAAGPPQVAAAAAALAVIGTVMWRRNSKARRLGWSSLLGILLCLATVSGGLVTAAGGAALAASSTALPDVTALPASPATTTPHPHPGCPHLQPLAAGTSLGLPIAEITPPDPRASPHQHPASTRPLAPYQHPCH